MRENSIVPRTSFYRQRDSTIIIDGKVNLCNVKDFCDAVSLFKNSNNNNLTIDFSNVQKAYPNGMLPIIATVQKLREPDIDITIRLPKDDYT